MTSSNETTLDRARRLAEGLFPHQIEGVAFLLSRRRAILADDMGLGKTRQCIVAMTQAAPDGPWLVVCPASVKLNWKREIRLALGDHVDVETDVAIVDRLHPVPDAGYRGWVVINYDILKRHLDALTAHDFAGIVFDEAHYLKNHTSQRSKAAAMLVIETAGDPVVHCLTGTPLSNRPRDLFPLLQLVNHPLGRHFLAFAKRYCDAYRGQFGWVTDGASRVEELTVQLHGTMLRRRKEEVLDLPKKLRSWFTIDVSVTARREAKGFLRAVIDERQSRRDEAMTHAKTDDAASPNSAVALLGKLAPVRKKIAIAKTKTTMEFVDGILDQGEKVIVYSCFTHPTEILAERFGDASRTLTGKTPLKRRQEIVDAFQTDDTVRVLIANIIAGGVGINLTAARHVVFNDLDWVPANHWQAEDRAYRIGQAHSVNAYYFTAKDTLDEFVGEVLKAKANVVRAIVEGESVAAEGANTADVLGELRRLVDEVDAVDSDDVDAWLDQAAGLYRERRLASESGKTSRKSKTSKSSRTTSPAVNVDAIAALARALDCPDAKRYRTRKTQSPGYYILEVDGTDVVCDCRGFTHRGQCRHAWFLKEAVVRGDEIPDAYEVAE